MDENETTQKDIPSFNIGDTVLVEVKVREGDRERTQPFEGVVIKKSGRGRNETFTVRRLAHGEGVERIFPTHSPLIHRIEMVRRGGVRRAKLYYLRGLKGRKSRVQEAKQVDVADSEEKLVAGSEEKAVADPEEKVVDER